MRPNDLERQFNEAIERVSNTTPPVRGPYGGQPLAGDHFLLQRSWDFFKRRLRTVEMQWGEITKSKDDRVTSLAAELEVMRQRLRELEDENSAFREFEDAVRRDWVSDRRSFDRDRNRIRERWTDEMDAGTRARDDLQRDIDRLKAEAASAAQRSLTLQKTADERIAKLQKDLADRLASQKGLQDTWIKTEADMRDQMAAMDRKLDLLRAEAARRDDMLKQNEEARRVVEVDRQALQRQLAEARVVQAESEKEIGHRDRRIRALETEIENMKRLWEGERAQWRELWDRERELRDRPRPRL